jgi:hypothetical protein
MIFIFLFPRPQASLPRESVAGLGSGRRSIIGGKSFTVFALALPGPRGDMVATQPPLTPRPDGYNTLNMLILLVPQR